MSNVLITGCSSGFGELTALALARRGDRVFATVRRPDAATGLTEAAAAESLPLSVHRLDVTDADSVDRVVAEIAARGDRIDALVNNAGMLVRGPVESLADDELARQLDTNVIGVVRMVRAVAPLMRARGAGTIVNISSLAGLVGVPFEGAYAASKHAVEALSEALRFELAAAGIRVLVIEPGAYDTAFSANGVEARAFGAEHPQRGAYERLWHSIDATLHADGRADPGEVVEAILGAIDHPEGAFRRLVGRDAHLICNLKRERSFEDFESAIRDSFDLEPSRVGAANPG